MTTSQIIACVISWTAAVTAITALALMWRARRQPTEWDTGDGVITFDRRLTDTEVEELKARWRREHGNTRAAHKVKELRPVDSVACSAYQPSADPVDSGLCARCGMYDYKHRGAVAP